MAGCLDPDALVRGYLGRFGRYRLSGYCERSHPRMVPESDEGRFVQGVAQTEMIKMVHGASSPTSTPCLICPGSS